MSSTERIPGFPLPLFPLALWGQVRLRLLCFWSTGDLHPELAPQTWSCCSAGHDCHTLRKCTLTASDRGLARALMPRPLSTWHPSAPCVRGLPAKRPCKFLRTMWVLQCTSEEHNSNVPFSLSYSSLPNVSAKSVSKTSLFEGMRIN